MARPIALVALVLLGLVLSGAAGAQGISYTVQVVALSDQEAALSVQRRLLDEGHPAYVVRAALAQGDVYRVRVGAFANRLAALVYAEAMPSVAGGRPLPALAEGIPPGVMPLEPRVLFMLSGSRAQVLSWAGGLALRVQEDPQRQATYHVTVAGTPYEFSAWRAVSDDGRVLRVTDLPLWPDDWREREEDELMAYRRTLLDSVAGRMGVTPQELDRWVLQPEDGRPYLVVAEQMDVTGLSSGLIEAVAAVEEPPTGTGPTSWVLGEAVIGPGEVLYESSATSFPVGTPLSGEGWEASARGAFFLLSSQGNSPWRAGIGTPLWSDGNHLLTRTQANRLLLYDFVPR